LFIKFTCFVDRNDVNVLSKISPVHIVTTQALAFRFIILSMPQLSKFRTYRLLKSNHIFCINQHPHTW